MRANTAKQAWLVQDGKRQGLLSKVELCCKLTLPRLWYDEGEEDSYAVSTLDFQSLGALCVSHMSNRTILTMFPPSRGFFRMEAPADVAKLAKELGFSEPDLAKEMSSVEQKAFRHLENSLQRPKLTRMAELLIATGNCLVVEEDARQLRVMSLRYYCVQRTRKGGLKSLIIREKLLFDELDDKLQAMLSGRFPADQTVDYYTWVVRQPGGSFIETVWVNDILLPNDYGSRYAKEEDLPYHVLTWSLADNKNYGTGLVEDYIRDFAALSAVSQAVTEGSVACAQNRILVDPGSTTKPDDFNTSSNNQAIPGTPETINNVMLGNPAGVQVSMSHEEKIDRRLRQAFMLTSGIIRQAERLTAFEIRKMAEEMDIQHGGSYSALSGTVQPWMAKWCLRGAKVPKQFINNDGISLVTGTDALSRNADVDNMRMAMEDLGAAQAIPEEVRAEISWPRLIAFVGAGRQTPLGDMLLTDAEKQQRQAQQTNQEAATTYATTAAQAAATPQ